MGVSWGLKTQLDAEPGSTTALMGNRVCLSVCPVAIPQVLFPAVAGTGAGVNRSYITSCKREDF